MHVSDISSVFREFHCSQPNIKQNYLRGGKNTINVIRPHDNMVSTIFLISEYFIENKISLLKKILSFYTIYKKNILSTLKYIWKISGCPRKFEGRQTKIVC